MKSAENLQSSRDYTVHNSTQNSGMKEVTPRFSL